MVLRLNRKTLLLMVIDDEFVAVGNGPFDPTASAWKRKLLP